MEVNKVNRIADQRHVGLETRICAVDFRIVKRKSNLYGYGCLCVCFIVKAMDLVINFILKDKPVSISSVV